MLPRRKFIATAAGAFAAPALARILPPAPAPARRILYLFGPLTAANVANLATGGFNVVVLAFLYVRRIAGKLHLTYNGVPVAAESLRLPALIRRLHPAITVMISIGGWGNRGIFEAIRAAGVPAFLDQFDREVVTPWGLQGIDLDLEPSHASENTPAGWHAVHDDLGVTLVDLTNQYMRRHPRHFVTHAPISSVAAALYINDGQVRGVRGSFLDACRTPAGNNLAWLNLQFYEAGDAPKTSTIPAYYHDALFAPLATQASMTHIARPLEFLIPGFEPRFHQTLDVCAGHLRGIRRLCGGPPGGVFLWQYGQIASDIQAWSRGLQSALEPAP